MSVGLQNHHCTYLGEIVYKGIKPFFQGHTRHVLECVWLVLSDGVGELFKYLLRDLGQDDPSACREWFSWDILVGEQVYEKAFDLGNVSAQVLKFATDVEEQLTASD